MSAGVERPPSVRLDDLARPCFSPETLTLRAAMADMGASIRLTPDAVLAAAAEETDLHDFGDDDFREGLDVLCRALHTDLRLSGPGAAALWFQLVQFAKNRLLLADLLARHPEIHDVEIERPIIIAGLPRTGTTHLHQLLAAHPDLRYLPYWESVEPFPVPGEDDDGGPTGATNPRVLRTAVGLDVLEQTAPHFKRMHEMTPEHAHEEIHLLAMDFSTMMFESQIPLPTYRDWFDARDQTSSYRYLRTVLQALQWQRGGDRWVLKSPQHLAQFRPIAEVFPDVFVVITHRDPAAVTLSVGTMLSYMARMQVDEPDPRQITDYWSGRIDHLLNVCLADREVLPADRSIDVRFQDYMADEAGTLGRIAEAADLPLGDDARAAIRAYGETHPRGRHGGVIYEPDVLGVDPDERRATLRTYIDRFGVDPEPLA